MATSPTSCGKCGAEATVRTSECVDCSERRRRRADQQRNRRKGTHVPSVTITGSQARLVAESLHELSEAVWALRTHVDSLDGDHAVSHSVSHALRAAETLASYADDSLEVLKPSFVEVRRAIERQPPKRYTVGRDATESQSTD